MSDQGPVAVRLPYPGGFPVYLSRFVLFGTAKKRVAMHFFNASEIEVTGLRFFLVEKDEKGKEIAVRPMEREGLSAERGSEFAVADAAVGKNCASVEVRMESVLSGAYEYSFEGEEVVLRYGSKERGKEVGFKRKSVYSASKKSKKYLIAALGLVLGFALIAGGIAWVFGFFGTAQPHGGETEGSVTEYYVEA